MGRRWNDLPGWGGVVGCQGASLQGCGGGATVTEAGPMVSEFAREIVNEEPSRHSSPTSAPLLQPLFVVDSA